MIDKFLFNSPLVGQRDFPVHSGPLGQPCIVGTDADQVSMSSDSTFIFRSTGGRSQRFPCSEAGKALYEIRPGDFVAVYLVDLAARAMMISCFQITSINANVAHATQYFP